MLPQKTHCKKILSQAFSFAIALVSRPNVGIKFRALDDIKIFSVAPDLAGLARTHEREEEAQERRAAKGREALRGPVKWLTSSGGRWDTGLVLVRENTKSSL